MHPDGTAPVGVSSEHGDGAVRRAVADRGVVVSLLVGVRIFFVDLREAANAVGRQEFLLIEHSGENPTQAIGRHDRKQHPVPVPGAQMRNRIKGGSALFPKFIEVVANPQYNASREIWQANFRPLFLTSFALKQFVASETADTATTIVITSASSKTAIGAALLLNTLTHIHVVGLTSLENVNFVEGLEC